jgi:hypothetical protein
MGIINKILSKLGSDSAKVEIDLIDKYVFHNTPFKVRISLKALEKKVKINRLSVDLVWKEFKMTKTHTYHTTHPSIQGRNEWYETHIIHKQGTRKPFEIAPGEPFSTELTFTTEKAKNTRFPDKFHIKIHVDIPNAVDLRESLDIDVLPNALVSAPMIAMVENLGFSREPWKKRDEDMSHRNQWYLFPEDGSHPHLHKVLLTVDDPRRGDLGISLNMMMCEDHRSPKKGIHEEIRSSFKIDPGDIVLQDDRLALGSLSSEILNLIKEAERQFNEILAMKN